MRTCGHLFMNTPQKVYFRKGAAAADLKDALGSARKILLVTGKGSVKKPGGYDQIMDLLKDKEVVEFSDIPSNRLSCWLWEGDLSSTIPRSLPLRQPQKKTIGMFLFMSIVCLRINLCL